MARKHFRASKENESLTKVDYEKCLENFRNDVHWGRTFYPCELHRYHIIAADRIIPIEHRYALKDDKKHLSTFDILIVAMSCELAYTGIREETYLVTCDRRMKAVVDKFQNVDLDELNRIAPLGPLGDIDKSRWIPPKCIDAASIRQSELESLRLDDQVRVYLASL